MISSLVWGDGFVELDEAAQDIAPGDVVRFLPFSGFGV
jgi:molybdopterin molybdotransferase